MERLFFTASFTGAQRSSDLGRPGGNPGGIPRLPRRRGRAPAREACELTEEQVATMRREVESAIKGYDFENGGPTYSYVTVGDALWGDGEEVQRRPVPC